jgi:hypothetical protein
VAAFGTRANGTNPRAVGTNPRANGTNPRANGSNPRSRESPNVIPWRSGAWQMLWEQGQAQREAEAQAEQDAFNAARGLRYGPGT